MHLNCFSLFLMILDLPPTFQLPLKMEAKLCISLYYSYFGLVENKRLTFSVKMLIPR